MLKRGMRLPNKRSGFTIIEVLIVLAIAGTILLMVFLVVPEAKRIQRNTHRKEFISLVFSSIEEYAQNNNSKYPDTPAKFCDLINKNLRNITPGMKTCKASFASGPNCVLVTGGIYNICYHNRFSSHNYLGPPDRINIQHGHWCGDDPTDTHEYPITDGTSTDSLLFHFAVWTRLEGSGVACISSN